jgi:hypothetical protein
VPISTPLSMRMPGPSLMSVAVLLNVTRSAISMRATRVRAATYE